MSQMKKAILFGAGGAGENFLTHNKQYQIIAVSDNNEKIWGSTLGDLPIIKPTEIAQLNPDYVIITSTWADSIQEQLLHKLYIPADKIIVPAKSQIKQAIFPFEHEPTLQLARKAMVAVSKYLIDHGVNLYVDFGTLLGLMRDGDIIPWDDDIDFALNEDEFEQAIELMRHFSQYGEKIEGVVWKVSLVTHADIEVSIQIEPEYTEKNIYLPFSMGIAKRIIVGDNSEVIGLSGMLYSPAKHFSGHDSLEAFGHKFYTPKNPESYLTFVYGDWKKPKKGMTFQDYNNRNIIAEVDLATIKTIKKAL